MEQLQHVESPFKPLPSLGPFLRSYQRWLFAWFMILLLENCVVPLILYYRLWYGTRAKPWLSLSFTVLFQCFNVSMLMSALVCTLITCIWGFVLYVVYTVALWKLIYKWSANRPFTSSHLISTTQSIDYNLSDTFREGNSNYISRPPLTASAPSRQYLDASRWMFLAMLTVTLAELVIGTIPRYPYIKLLAMVNPSMLCVISLVIFTLDVASLLHVRAPFRISSIAKGELVRPGIYTLLEDVVSVDLHGGYAFRARLNERWEESPLFRRLLYQLSILWSLPGLLVSAACTIAIFMTVDDVGFAFGWGLPYVWAILWTAVTVVIVNRGLGKEKQEWEAKN